MNECISFIFTHALTLRPRSRSKVRLAKKAGGFRDRFLAGTNFCVSDICIELSGSFECEMLFIY